MTGKGNGMVMEDGDEPLAPKDFIVEGFVFSDDTGVLADHEYVAMCRRLDEIETVLALRDARFTAGEDGGGVHRPGNNWNPEKPQTFELDGVATNAYTSFRLLMTRDRHVLRKLRLYTQAFSGYQLATLSPAGLRPWIRQRLPDNHDVFLRMLVHWEDPVAASWVFLARDLPRMLLVSPPPRLGEIGWLIANVIVNRDTVNYLERITLLHHNGVLSRLRSLRRDRPIRILEIGGGYGSLAHILTTVFEAVDYTIVDLPESLAFSYLYLSTVLPELPHRLIRTPVPTQALGSPGMTYVPNFLADVLEPGDRPYDFVINTLSFAEMTTEQVAYYGRRIAELMSPDGVLFDQNQDEPDDAEGLSPLDRALIPHLPGRRLCQLGPLPELTRGRARLWSLHGV